MDNNSWAWLDYDRGDWHFSEKGHVALAYQMYKIITQDMT
jgi:hypothetical protein